MNRLSKEKSPYLLQHKNNPVDWYPWGPEAFSKAKKENKPVFLSIGYSTCHWCHVMEHESFEDSQVAKLMNETFVNIKVDREERPDIDHLYMSVCQMMTGGGGWPLTIVMTPDQKPFFSGTYFPKESRFGRIGMVELISRFRELWKNENGKVLESANQVTSFILENQDGSGAKEEIVEQSVREAQTLLKNNFDPEWGGFGESPKFPTPHNLMFLLRTWKRFNDAESLQMVEKTLKSMREGGMYDHLGFGFHRYSVDREWLVPHFEKMLYDQALLAFAYLEVYQATGNELYSQTADEIFEYVMRDMTGEGGGFYSAEDADSEGEEGKFYVWSWAELKEVLGEMKLNEIASLYGVRPEGNFTDMGHASPNNILHFSRNSLTEDLKNSLDETRLKLLEVRGKRIRPHLDDKILADWNGLMIAALARGAQVLPNEKILDRAQKAFEFVTLKMTDKDSRLFHRYRDGESAVTGVLDDYAFMIWAAIELYGATFDSAYLSKALQLTEQAGKYFWDSSQGGYFFTAHDGESLLLRKKEIYDGATPSGNSVMLWNLLRLGRLTGRAELDEKAHKLLLAFSSDIKRYPAGHSMFMIGTDFGLGPSKEVVVTGPSNSQETKAALDTLSLKFSPHRVLIFKPSDVDDAITKLANFTEPLKAISGKPTIYICRGFTCDKPTTDLSEALAKC